MKVTIIIPYNVSRGYLGQAVTAAEHQEGMKLNEDYEVIVQHGDCGVSENINRALKKAKGDYIKLCAEDDVLALGCLNDLYPFAVAGGYDFVCADAYNFENDKQILDLVQSVIPATVANLAERNTIHGGTILYRRDALPEFNEDYWTGEEYDITLRMASQGCKFGKLNKVVFWYRCHARQKSLVYKSENGEMIKRRFRFIRDTISATYANNHFRIVR